MDKVTAPLKTGYQDPEIANRQYALNLLKLTVEAASQAMATL